MTMTTKKTARNNSNKVVSEGMVPLYHLELVRDEPSFPYTKIDKVEAAAEVFHKLLDNSHVEKMAVIYCNAGGEMIGAEVIAIGRLTNVGADMSDIFKGAILANAASIWMAHNHPGGVNAEKAQASVPDFLFTTKVLEASEILGIPLNDHLVIMPGSHYSLRENSKEMSEKTRKALEEERMRAMKENPLIAILGGLGGAIAATNLQEIADLTPWDRGINKDWPKEASHMGCGQCDRCIARAKRKKEVQ